MTVKVKINRNWASNIKKSLDTGLLEMVNEIHFRAILLAPVDSGDLADDGEVTLVPNGYQVKFGSSDVPYARRRHFENKKTPQSKGYLAKAGDSIARGDKTRYFKGKI